jgi:hypothetical protein
MHRILIAEGSGLRQRRGAAGSASNFFIGIEPPVGAAAVAIQRHMIERVILGIERPMRGP